VLREGQAADSSPEAVATLATAATMAAATPIKEATNVHRAYRRSPARCTKLFQLARPMLVQFKIAHLLPLREAAIVYTAVSFRVALRSQPIYAQASLQPFIDFSFALKVLDVPDFGSGVVSLDLPIARRDAVVFEGDPR
jgi:hypothetical protein